MASMRVLLAGGLLMALSYAVNKAHADDYYSRYIECDVSDASPVKGDVDGAVMYLSRLGRQTECCLDNCRGSGCTTMSQSGSAAVGICWIGGKGCYFGCLSCSRAAVIFNAVAQQCMQFQGQVMATGGYTDYKIDAVNWRFIVFNAADV